MTKAARCLFRSICNIKALKMQSVGPQARSPGGHLLDTHSGFFYHVKGHEEESRAERSKRPELLKQGLGRLQV